MRTSNPPSPLDSNQNYVNGDDLPTPPPMRHTANDSTVSRFTPPAAETEYTTSQVQHNSRYTPSPPQPYNKIITSHSPQPVNKITPVVISVKIPENPNIYEKKHNIETSVTNGSEQTVKIPTTSMVVKKKESFPSLIPSPVSDDGQVGHAVIRTVDSTPQRVVLTKNEQPRTPPILTIPPPPAPPPPPLIKGPTVTPKPQLNNESNCKLSFFGRRCDLGIPIFIKMS